MPTVQELLLRVGGDGSEAESMFENLSGGLTSMISPAGLVVGAIAAVGVALVGLGTYGVLAADDVQHALNTLQTQTGATDEEMKGLEDSLLSIYGQNYGEDYEDIAESMAKVKQNSEALGIQTTKDLENMTKDALVLRDTFGFEVDETVRATTSLVSKFGLTGEEAYNLIAQGAQNGLNKNGDMLDILNEYSPQFQALGFTAEDMFNTLIAGADNGAFSIDKVGDAVKEFNVRAKDGSDATKQAFKDLGFDADEMTKRFAAGGDTAREAFLQVNQKLMTVDDSVKQNQLGVALWGTMYEDLEKDGVAALINVDDKTNKTKDTLKEIDSIKYNTFGEALSGLKRQFDVNVAVPIGKVILPILSKLMEIFLKVSDAIKAQLLPIFNEVKNKIKEAFSGSMPDIDSFVNLIIENIPGAFQIIKDIAFPVIDNMIQFIKNLVGVGKGEFKTSFIDMIKEEVPNIIEQFKKIADQFKRLWEAMVEFSQSEAFGVIIKIFIKVAAAVYKSILTIIQVALKVATIFGKVQIKIIKFTTKVSEVFVKVKAAVVRAFKEMGSNIKSIWNSIKSGVTSGYNAIKSGLSSFGSWLKSAIPNAFRRAVSLAKSAWNKLVSGIKSIIGSAKSAARSVINGVKSAITGTSLYSAGKKIIQSLINGIKALASVPAKEVGKIVSGIRNLLPFSPAKEGPLKDLDKTGPGFIKTIITGIKKKTPALNAIITGLVEKMNIQNNIPTQQLNLNGAGAANVIVNINEPHIFNDKDIDYLATKLMTRFQSHNIQPERR